MLRTAGATRIGAMPRNGSYGVAQEQALTTSL
jgi:hypothetical protein